MTKKKSSTSRPPVTPSQMALPIIAAVVGAALFLLPVPEIINGIDPEARTRFWSLDYILFAAFLFGIPALMVPGRGWALRVVVGLITALLLLTPNVLHEENTPAALRWLMLAFALFIIVVPTDTRKLRGPLILFALAYFGALQAACPRLPGAIELTLLHLTDDNPIIMQVIKIAVILGLALLFGRYYCGYVCPKGVIQEYLYRPRIGITPSPRVDRVLKKGKYLTLALLVGLPLAYDYALFREIGPFRVIFNLRGSTLMVIFLAVVLVTSLFIERAYCRYFCPEGGLLALVQLISPYKMRFDRSSCTRCGRCVKVCPVDAFEVEGKCPTSISHTECIACLECQAACRDGSLVYAVKHAGAPASSEHGDAPECEEKERSET